MSRLSIPTFVFYTYSSDHFVRHSSLNQEVCNLAAAGQPPLATQVKIFVTSSPPEFQQKQNCFSGYFRPILLILGYILFLSLRHIPDIQLSVGIVLPHNEDISPRSNYISVFLVSNVLEFPYYFSLNESILFFRTTCSVQYPR